MKKFFTIFLIIFMANISSSYAYTSGFQYMINAMKIQMTNVNGLMLNEEIYKEYNLLVYGSPLTVNSPRQFWKSVETGKWTKNGGAWTGIGERGEYCLLGEDISGRPVHNELYPDDYVSGTLPTEWIYKEVDGAEESWNDVTKYVYEEQRDYMLTQKLSRYGVVYDLTVMDIGKNKARAESYPTWGSAGSVYTEKPGEGNMVWFATFSVPPMAGDAKLHSILEFQNGLEYTILPNEKSIEIPINFGAYIDGLSSYAKENHIKLIESELKINGVVYNSVNASECIRIGKNTSLIVDKDMYKNMKKVVFEIECNSLATTYFNDDKMFYATEKKTVVVNIQDEETDFISTFYEENAPVIYSIDIKRVTTKNGRTEYVDLYENTKTRMPFVCAGQVIQIEVVTSASAKSAKFDFSGYTSIKTLDDNTKRFLWDEPKERKEKTIVSSYKGLQSMYDLPNYMSLVSANLNTKTFRGIYVVPYNTYQTIHSWNSLREISKDAFKIDESKLFTRRESPFSLVVIARSNDASSSRKVSFDVAERWDELYNYDISQFISNK